MRTIKLPLRRMFVPRNMRGHGLGGLFARLATMMRPLLQTAVRAAKPIAKQTLKELGRQGMEVVGSTLTDVIESGVPVKEAIKKNARGGVRQAAETVKRGAKRAATEIREEIKRQKQAGGGISKRSAVGKRPPKKHFQFRKP